MAEELAVMATASETAPETAPVAVVDPTRAALAALGWTAEVIDAAIRAATIAQDIATSRARREETKSALLKIATDAIAKTDLVAKLKEAECAIRITASGILIEDVRITKTVASASDNGTSRKRGPNLGKWFVDSNEYDSGSDLLAAYPPTDAEKAYWDNNGVQTLDKSRTAERVQARLKKNGCLVGRIAK